MSFKITLFAFLGNMCFYTIDPLITLYVKIKFKLKRWFNYKRRERSDTSELLYT